PCCHSPRSLAIWVAAPAVTLTVADVTLSSPLAPNRKVRGPTVPAIERVVNTAWPFAPVVADVVPPSVPPPDWILTPTATLAWPTGLPEPSCSWITGCCRKGTPLCALAEGCVTIASRVALPAVAVAEKVTGLPCSVADVAVKVLGPAALPRVQLVTAATPLALVVWAAPVMLPPPVPGAKVTATPATGLPKASCTITAGGTATAVPTVAAWPSPTLIAMDAAAAAVTLTLAVAVTAVTPLSVALIVFVSALVELSVAVAWPLAPVRLVGWASALFVPLAARVTVTPLTGLPNSSFAVTVIVAALAPVDAVIAAGVAATSDRAALGAPAVPVAVNVI